MRPEQMANEAVRELNTRLPSLPMQRQYFTPSDSPSLSSSVSAVNIRQIKATKKAKTKQDATNLWILMHHISLFLKIVYLFMNSQDSLFTEYILFNIYFFILVQQ